MLSSSKVVYSILIVLKLSDFSNGIFNSNKPVFAINNLTFPLGFILGVSTSAYQIEGGWDEGGKGESAWDTYLHKNPNYTLDGQNADVATDSYHRYKDDIKIIKELGVDYYRMSISWPRILPNGTDHNISKDGVRYYSTIFGRLLKANITPVVTLYHWDLPSPLMDLGGWSNPKVVDYFEDYARVVFKLFGGIVKLWTTLNEPHQHCYNGYGGKIFVPALESSGVGDYLCTHYSLLAHARVYRLYDREFRPLQNGKIGITLDSFWAEPKNNQSSKDQEAVERYMQMHLGIYAHPIFSEKGDYPELVRKIVDGMSLKQGFQRSRLPYFTPREVEMIKGSSDFFGLNHYTTYLVSPSSHEPGWRTPSWDQDTGLRIDQNPDWPKPGAPWFSVYPPGFRRLLNWISEEYGRQIPIVITENGMCDNGTLKDYGRVEYFNNYLYQMLLAIYEDGCNVQGYFAWTLMDDFEWGDGYSMARLRSRSVTPSRDPAQTGPHREAAARRALIMGLVEAVSRPEPILSPSPLRLHAFPVQATPGGSLSMCL